jgi:hypothetical protein
VCNLETTDQPKGNQPDKKVFPTKTVLFVEQKSGGLLAKQMRQIEMRTSEMVGFKTKIVKREGTKLQHLLPNTNPWKGAAYGKINCIPFGQDGDQGVQELEEQEAARGIVLKGGSMDVKPGTESRQTQIKIWSETQLYFRKLALEIIDHRKTKASFQQNLLSLSLSLSFITSNMNS